MSKSRLLRFIPDRAFLKIKYRSRMGKGLNLSNPVSFNEKLQWLKLYDHNPLYTKLVDKYRVRGFIKDTIGEKYLNELYGVYDGFSDIDFSHLPKQFVLKCNHDCGSILICREGLDSIDLVMQKKRFDKAIQSNYFYEGREWPYKDVKPCIIAERYLTEKKEDDNEIKGIRDYKYFCFNGIPKFLYISEGLENHATAKVSFYDLNGNQLPFWRTDYKPFDYDPVPDNLSEINDVATKLAKAVNAPFVRVDLFSIAGEIYFSEFTFFPCGGTLPFEPIEWDKTLGSWIDIGKAETL